MLAPGFGEVSACLFDLLGGVEEHAVVDPDGVGVLVLDDGAVDERRRLELERHSIRYRSAKISSPSAR
jgi:hypothetical protein